MEEIVVTGSRIARIGSENSTPVSTISVEQIESSGMVALEDVLLRQPQFIGGSTSRSNTSSMGAATINLRGLGAQRNLVLVNGRRYIFTGSNMVTDINTLPAALVERVDIVTGGSSAVYGSDAISGVTNFILREDFEGVEMKAQLGGDTRGDALTQSYDLTLGTNFAGGRGNFVVSGNYYKRGSILNGDRAYSRIPLKDDLVNGEPVLSDRSSINSHNGAFQGLLYGNSLSQPQNAGLASALDAAGLSGVGVYGFTFDGAGSSARPFDYDNDRYNIARLNYLQTPAERYGLSSFGHFDISDDVTLYSEGAYYNTEVNLQLAETNINRNMAIDVDNPYVSVQMQEVFRQQDLLESGDNRGDGKVNLKVGRRFTELGSRHMDVSRDVYRIGGGLRGNLPDASDSFLFDTTFDASYFYAQADSTTLFTNMVSQSKLWAGVLRGADGSDPLVNLFGEGSISPEAVKAIGVDGMASTSTKAHNVMASVSSHLLNLPAGPVGVALGMEYRDSSVENTVDDVIGSYDIIGQDPMFDNRGSLNVWDVFGEVRLPLLPSDSAIGKVSANGALRYSHYSIPNAKNIWTYLGGLEWSPVNDLNLRGQWQHAVRAPNIGELYSGQWTNRTSQIDPCAVPSAADDPVLRDLCIATGVPASLVGDPAIQPSGQVDALFGSNPNLKVEKSDTLSLGFTYMPNYAPGLTLAVDYFRIDVKDAISSLGGGVPGIFDLCYNVLRDPNSSVCEAINRSPTDGAVNDPYYVIAANTNIGRIETSGIDFALAWQTPLDFGFNGDGSRLSVNLNGTWLHQFDSTPMQDLPDEVNECIGTFGGICGTPNSRWRTNTSVSWSSAGVTLGVAHRFRSGVKDARIALAEQRDTAIPNLAVPNIDGQHYVDLMLRYDYPKSDFSIYAGVNNVLDKQPPMLGSSQQESNTWPSAYDALGAEYFMGVKYKF